MLDDLFRLCVTNKIRKLKYPGRDIREKSAISYKKIVRGKVVRKRRIRRRQIICLGFVI